MGKITCKNRKGKITIINRLSYPETVNERVFNAITAGMFEGLLPVSIVQRRKEIRLECEIQELIPLKQYFNDGVTRRMFLDFVHEIALLIKNCEKNMINANNLDLHMDKIFIDPQSKNVKCIFWPVVNNKNGNPPHLFLKQLPYELNFNAYEYDDYLETYKSFFGGITPFSVNCFDKMVLELSGKKVGSDRKIPFEKMSDTLAGDVKLKRKEIDKRKNVNIEYDPFAYHYDHVIERKNEKGSKNISNNRFSASHGQRKQTDVNSGMRQNVLGKKYPTLTCLRTAEVQSINTDIFRIGAGRKCTDFFVCDNNYISKRHADIVTRKGRYYIVDRNSTNKTYVNGKVVPAGMTVEIFSGTQILLANEEFIFDIKS